MDILLFVLALVLLDSSLLGTDGRILPNTKRESLTTRENVGEHEANAGKEILENDGSLFPVFPAGAKGIKPSFHIMPPKRLPHWLRHFFHNPFEMNPLMDASQLNFPRMFRHQWPWIRDDHTSTGSSKVKGEVIGGRVIFRTKMGAPPLLRIISFTTHGRYPLRQRHPSRARISLPKVRTHNPFSGPTVLSVNDLNDRGIPDYTIQAPPRLPNDPDVQDDIDGIELVPLPIKGLGHDHSSDKAKNEIAGPRRVEVAKKDLVEKTDSSNKEAHRVEILLKALQDDEGSNANRPGPVPTDSAPDRKSSLQMSATSTKDIQPERSTSVTKPLDVSKQFDSMKNLDKPAIAEIKNTNERRDLFKRIEARKHNSSRDATKLKIKLKTSSLARSHPIGQKDQGTLPSNPFGTKQQSPKLTTLNRPEHVNSVLDTSKSNTEEPSKIQHTAEPLKSLPVSNLFQSKDDIIENEEKKQSNVSTNTEPRDVPNVVPFRRKLLSIDNLSRQTPNSQGRKAGNQEPQAVNGSGSNGKDTGKAASPASASASASDNSHGKDTGNAVSSASVSDQSGDTRGPVDPADGYLLIPVHKSAQDDVRKEDRQPINNAPKPQDNNVGSDMKQEDMRKSKVKDGGRHRAHGSSNAVLVQQGISNPDVKISPVVTDVPMTLQKANGRSGRHKISTGSLKIIITLVLLGLVLALLLVMVSRASSSGNTRRVDSTTALYTPSPRY